MRSYKEIYEEVSNAFDFNYKDIVKRLNKQEEKVLSLYGTCDESYVKEDTILASLEIEYDLINERFFKQLEKELSNELKVTYLPNESEEFAAILFEESNKLCKDLSDIESYYVKLLNMYKKLNNLKN